MNGFKTQAINAQGSILAIGDTAAGTPVTITAITKANPAVVTSATPAKVGDVVTFGTVTGMPEINGKSAIVTAVGTGEFTVDIDASGFAAAGTTGDGTILSFIAGCEVKSFNGFDGQSAEIDCTTLCSPAREFLSGLQDFGSFNFDVNLVPNDPFQMACNEAKRLRERRTFTLTLPPGEDGAQFAYVFDAFVRQFTISGGVDQAVAGSVVLRVTGEPTLLEVTAP
jgi:hypothetical protein